jgi:hypothetical protein
MDVPKLAVHWHWVEQVLVPYLQYAFTRDLQFGDDNAPIVRNAVKFCETKPVSHSVCARARGGLLTIP